MNRKKWSILVIAGCLIINFLFINQMIAASNLYDIPADKILLEYREKESSVVYTTSILNNSELEAHLIFLCGNSGLCSISTPETTKLNLSCDRISGEGKLLFENQENGKIDTVLLKEAEKDIIVEQGEYEVFLTGKWFCGDIVLKSGNNDVILQAYY